MENKVEKQNVSNMKQELIKKEYQDNLTSYLDSKLDEVIEKLQKSNKNLSTIELRSLLAQKNTIGVSPKYNNTELAILFDYYQLFIENINKVKQFLPTKKNFCSFIGVSSKTYDNWRQAEDIERQEIMQKIDDYITDILLTSAQDGEVKEISTIYRTKAEHGMVEASNPIIIEHKSQADINSIMKQIEAVNQGKSLRTIELKQQDDGSYAEEEN
ncbi:MAG: hypothetical protein E7310_06395 [Clostridiales bacterium]|nr:hypothetical protein [Clostridiales bacterium]